MHVLVYGREFRGRLQKRAKELGIERTNTHGRSFAHGSIKYVRIAFIRTNGPP